ncbi:MAG: phosphate acetyltransferase [Granulosicoccus sp.]
MPVFDRVLDAARRQLRSVVLPEANDERILTAAVAAQSMGIAKPVMLGNPDRVTALAQALNLDPGNLKIIDPTSKEQHERYIDALVRKREHRGMTAPKAREALRDTVTFACMMVSEGDADACVAGAVTATADVVRSAVRYVGKREGEPLVSSCFIMLLNDEHPVADVMVIGDCALAIDPDAEQLAAIAISTGESAQRFLGMTPQVAMLSFSTAGSARHASVTKVNQATALARQQRPDWRIVGEVQLDAAVIPSLLSRKAPEQATDEPCNVLVFPNLDAGNIGYKLIERFGGAEAVGPILQGLARPVNDLSRGCSTDDVIKIIAVSAAQVTD